MDIFVEQLVKKKRDGKDMLKIILSIVGAFVIIALLGLLSAFVPFIGMFMLLAVVGLIYGLYVIITSVNLEYEYAFTEGELDVDKVINARRRKRMTSFDVNDMEVFADKNYSEFNRYMNNPRIEKLWACADREGDDLCFAVYNSGGASKMLLFSPNEKIREGFRVMAPRKVFLSKSQNNI